MLLQLTILTSLNVNWMHTGKISTLIYDFHAQLHETGSRSEVFRYE